MMAAQGRNQGFTLLEIMVALAVLAIVVISAVRNNNSFIDNSTYLRDKTLAHYVAMNKAAELRLADKWIGLGKSEGDSVLAGRRWHWILTGKNTPDADIRIAEIVVRAKGAGKDDILTRLAIYLGRPLS